MRARSLALLAALLFAGLVLILAAKLRGPEYDEGYTAFVTSLAPRPAWPAIPFRAGDVRRTFRPAPSPWRIAPALRQTDVHPPLYFWTVWAWRRLWGPGLFVSRLLSVAFSLAGLAGVVAIGRSAGLPALPACLLTLGCFGFVETGITARGYALAQALQVAGLGLTLRAAARGRREAGLAGLVFGAASFTNYLAAFPAVAAGFWLLGRGWRRVAAFALGLAPFVIADAWFFWAQRGSRIGQFPPFTARGFLAAIGRAIGGAVLGGLPLSLPPGAARIALGLLLALLLGLLLLLPPWRWRLIGAAGPRKLLALAAVSVPCGLLLMGIAADSLPIEIRYLAFALPPFMLLLAGAISSLPRRWAGGLLAIILGVQALSITGLMTAPATMQPEGASARQAARAAGTTGLVLLPRGNDGVGIVSAFLTAAPDSLHILLVGAGATAARLAPLIARFPCAVAPVIAVDRESRAVRPLIEAMLRRTSKCIDAP